jgi:valyl-tRNA synthetase
MEIAKTYEPGKAENKWYSYWMEQGFFRSVPDNREPYTIVIPPPNVTGVLHMGHMLNNTIQDVLIRRARMQGKNACWVPGTDHASIATEAKVVALLKEKGINKKDLSREDFLKHAWEWKEKYGGIILEQLKKLGASCDWERTRFTMEEDLSAAVIQVFVDLYNKGYIYRGVRMVNWDPAGLTAVSDEEVIYREVSSRLYHVKYRIAGTDDFVTIATTRPETILGDTAVCVNPGDERYRHLRGRNAIVPIVNREVPVIFDEYVTMDFGTGALKVTPAHDINDYQLGITHNLEVIDTINPNGTMSPAAGFYIGEDRFAVRKKIVKDLENMGLITKVEEIRNKVGYSERTDAVIEPRLSMQWFLKMDTISRPALENVMNSNIKLYPDKFRNTYRNWMENVHDWCISRQLWWGQRIPAYYLPDGNVVVAETREKAFGIAKEKYNVRNADELRQDEDVLDTWFSSWLWPISVFDGFKAPGNPDIKYYYPTNDLVTAPEILFFWVARMIIAGYEYMGDKPFSNVYLTGIVRDKLGRKMSKSLGNSPDPLDLIAKYGADGVRVGMLFSSPAGNDLLFDESLCEQGRNFANKIWNAFRLVKGWAVEEADQPGQNKISVDWFQSKMDTAIEEINDHFAKFRLSDALMSIYKLVWDDFCSWYLEMIKPAYLQPIDKSTYDSTVGIFETLLRLVHPFMPFITEEIWHLIKERAEKECIIVADWPSPSGKGPGLLAEFEIAQEIIGSIRNFRKEKNIPLKEKLNLLVKKNSGFYPRQFEDTIIKLGNLESIGFTQVKADNSYTFIVKADEYFIPVQVMDTAAEREKLLSELEYTRGFLKSVQSKLANERFVSNAKPEVVENERKKLADAEAKMRVLEEQLTNLRI